MASAFAGQIQNRNFLSPVGFKFILAKDPKVSFFSNAATIPEITLGTAIQPTYLKDIDVPGDKLQYGDLTLRFLVDEDMQNYMSIHNWLTGLGYPETTQQFTNLITDENGIVDYNRQFSDGTLQILDSNFNSKIEVRFKGLFPVSLTPLEFDATETDINYFTSEATFKYTIYNIVSSSGNPL